MKYIFPVILTLFFSLESLSQIQEDIFPKANTIILKSTIEKTDLLIYWGRYLVENGFEIEKMDKDFFTLKTSPKDFSVKNCLDCEFYIFSIATDENEIKSTIKFRFKTHGTQLLSGRDQFPFYDWEYVGNKKNPGFLLFEKIYPLFSGFDNSKLLFSISK